MNINNDILGRDFNLSEVMHGHINDKVDCIVAEQWQTGRNIQEMGKQVHSGNSIAAFFGATALITGLATVYVVASMKDEQERHNRRIEERLGLD